MKGLIYPRGFPNKNIKIITPVKWSNLTKRKGFSMQVIKWVGSVFNSILIWVHLRMTVMVVTLIWAILEVLVKKRRNLKMLSHLEMAILLHKCLGAWSKRSLPLPQLILTKNGFIWNQSKKLTSKIILKRDSNQVILPQLLWAPKFIPKPTKLHQTT